MIGQKERDEIESSQFAANAVEPHTTQSGFFFFDVGDIPSPLAGAHLYVTGVNDAKGHELMYFEIPMEVGASWRVFLAAMDAFPEPQYPHRTIIIRYVEHLADTSVAASTHSSP